MKKIAIVGCGRMGSFLAGKLAPKYELYVYDQVVENALQLAESCGAKAVVEKEDLKEAQVIILALATEVVPKAVQELASNFGENAVIVNIATTLPHSQLVTKLKKVSAKIIGHAKEMAVGERPVIIVEGDDPASEKLVMEIFSHVGPVEKGNSHLVMAINTLASKQGIITALNIQKELEKMDVSDQIIKAAIRNVAAGTMKAFALGDVGPFAQAIVDQYEEGKK